MNESSIPRIISVLHRFLVLDDGRQSRMREKRVEFVAVAALMRSAARKYQT